VWRRTWYKTVKVTFHQGKWCRGSLILTSEVISVFCKICALRRIQGLKRALTNKKYCLLLIVTVLIQFLKLRETYNHDLITACTNIYPCNWNKKKGRIISLKLQILLNPSYRVLLGKLLFPQPVKIRHLFYRPAVSSPCSRQHSDCLYPEPDNSSPQTRITAQ
jgi:hypothetical protein